LTGRLPKLLERRWPWLLAAFLVRLAFALKLGDANKQIDELGFTAAALQLATTGVLGTGGEPGIVPPVPAGFFAACFFFGHRLLFPRLFQVLVGTAVCHLIGEITERVSCSKLAGRLALVLACVYPYYIYYGGMVMSETLDLFFLIPGLGALCEAFSRENEQEVPAAAGGLCMALAALCRAEGAFIMLGIWALGAALWLRGRFSGKALGVGLAVWAFPILLFCARNKAQTGHFALDAHGGMAMVHGNPYFELNNVDTGLAQKEIDKQAWYVDAQKLPAMERDRVYLKEAFRWMKDNPGKTLYYWAWKLGKFWRPVPRLDKDYNESVHSDPSAGAPRWALWIISFLFEPWIILLGLAGFWKHRAKFWCLFPLHAWIAGTCAIHVVSVSQPRYRLPVMPALMIAACWLVAEAWERRRLSR
jgi:hypothetical protein